MNRRTTKYTKKQIQEALAYWSRQLRESGGDMQDFNTLVQLAQKMSPDTAKAAQAAKKIVDGSKELDESTGGGVMIGIASTLLAACMIGKMANKVEEYVDSLGVGSKAAKIEKSVKTNVKAICEAVSDISEDLHEALPELFGGKPPPEIEHMYKEQFERIMNQD